MPSNDTSTAKQRRGRLVPVLVVSAIAVGVALAGTGVAATVVPLAKRALTADKAKIANKANVADNALALEGQTAEAIAATPGPGQDAQTLSGQTAAQIAATPGPSSSLSGQLLTLRTNSWESDREGQVGRVTAQCQPGERVTGGGWTQDAGHIEVIHKGPTPTGTGWTFGFFAESGDRLAATGTVYAICLKVAS